MNGLIGSFLAFYSALGSWVKRRGGGGLGGLGGGGAPFLGFLGWVDFLVISWWTVVDFLEISWWRWRTFFLVISLVSSGRRIFWQYRGGLWWTFWKSPGGEGELTLW